jgi:hypothetical protein
MKIIKLKDPKKIEGLKITENFSAKEFACNHCKEVVIEEQLVQQLQQLRDVFNTGIIITSGYRCPTHNARVGGWLNKVYILREKSAVDFTMLGEINAFQVFTEACKIFNRVGLYQSSNNPLSAYMHVDSGEKGTWWLSYPVASSGRTKRIYVYYKSLANLAKAISADKQRDWLNMVI